MQPPQACHPNLHEQSNMLLPRIQSNKVSYRACVHVCLQPNPCSIVMGCDSWSQPFIRLPGTAAQHVYMVCCTGRCSTCHSCKAVHVRAISWRPAACSIACNTKQAGTPHARCAHRPKECTNNNTPAALILCLHNIGHKQRTAA